MAATAAMTRDPRLPTKSPLLGAVCSALLSLAFLRSDSAVRKRSIENLDAEAASRLAHDVSLPREDNCDLSALPWRDSMSLSSRFAVTIRLFGRPGRDDGRSVLTRCVPETKPDMGRSVGLPDLRDVSSVRLRSGWSFSESWARFFDDLLSFANMVDRPVDDFVLGIFFSFFGFFGDRSDLSFDFLGSVPLLTSDRSDTALFDRLFSAGI